MKATIFTRNMLASALGVVLVATASTSVADDAMMQAFEGYKTAWNSHDMQTLSSYFTEDATYTDPGTGKLSGPAIAGAVQGLFTAIPDFKVQILSADAVDEDTLAEQWVISGTWTKPFPSGPLAGAQPSGKSFTVPGSSFLEWQGDKIRSSVHYYDQLAFLTQIGVIPPPGEKPQASAK
ncbi:MAG: ester cyclase [Gammaproteobacteria bacterium]